MKKGSQSRRCGHCNRIVFRIVPEKSTLGISFSKAETVLDFRFRKERSDGYGHYYCMDCLKKLFPDEYKTA